ncbi:hypothetical protein EJB05_10872, partial [Eragrostis curvula]
RSGFDNRNERGCLCVILCHFTICLPACRLAMGTRLMRSLSLRRLLAQQRSTAGRKSRAWSSTVSFSDVDEKNETDVEGGDDFTGPRKNRGREFRRVRRAIICGKVGQTLVQKILRSGHTVTVFTVGTGGMWDQRIEGADLPMPAQLGMAISPMGVGTRWVPTRWWHRIAVHNDQLGAFAVQKLVKNTYVYVEGDIETRVYNDNVNDQVKNIPEICVRRDGKINLIQSGQTNVSQSLDELSKLCSFLHFSFFMFYFI